MTNRYYALTVVLKKDIRDDDAEPIINAIRMIKGVGGVEPHVADIETYMAITRARLDLQDKLWKVLHGTET